MQKNVLTFFGEDSNSNNLLLDQYKKHKRFFITTSYVRHIFFKFKF